MSGDVYQVRLMFKPEKDEIFSSEEILSFSSEKNAREFISMQKGKKTLSAINYLGKREKKNGNA